jgi:hypothetical protein
MATAPDCNSRDAQAQMFLENPEIFTGYFFEDPKKVAWKESGGILGHNFSHRVKIRLANRGRLANVIFSWEGWRVADPI